MLFIFMSSRFSRLLLPNILPAPPSHPPPPRTKQQLAQLAGSNPYALAPIAGAPLTQDAFISQAGFSSDGLMSLGDMLGNFSLTGGAFAGGPVPPSQGYLDSALPEFRGVIAPTPRRG